MFMMGSDYSTFLRRFPAAFLYLAYCLSSVSCDIFCPPVIENQVYSITAEKYDLTDADLNDLTLIWNFGQNTVTCNFTAQLCTSGIQVFDNDLQFQIQLFGVDNVQFTCIIRNFTKSLTGRHTVQWDIRGISTTDTCQVEIGNAADECVQKQPCENAGQCKDLTVGFECKCPVGYTGKTCKKADFRLGCDISVYRVQFILQQDLCIDLNISCNVAGVPTNEDIGLSYNSTSINSGPTVQAIIAGREIFFNVCITASVPLGVYQISYEMLSSRSKNSFQVYLQPEVGQRNTAPIFNSPAAGGPYIIKFPETGFSQGAILKYVYKSKSKSCTDCIEVIDPDLSSFMGTDSLSLTVSLESPQPAEVSYMSNAATNTFGYFYLSGQPTSTTNISFLLMVTDGEQATASSRVIFMTAEANLYAPVCTTSTIKVDLDIRTIPDQFLGALKCTDLDLTAENNVITYHIEGHYSNYFRIDQTGTIFLYKSVMDLQPGMFSFNVTVSDSSAQSNNAYYVYIPVIVNLTVPEPMCSLTVTSLPALWGVTSTAVLQLQCDIQGVDKLNVTSWNFDDIFDVQTVKESSTVYKINLTVKKYIPSTYGFAVMATLGGAGTLASVILSCYNPPMFVNLPLTVTVEVASPVGMIFLTLTAISDNPAATLTYSLKNENYKSLFKINNDGSLELINQLQPYVGSTLQLDFEVHDSISNLTATSSASINVQDINEPPVCVQPGTISINSNLSPNSTITKIICSDPDTIPAYKNLLYSISYEPTSVPLFIRDNGDVVLFHVLPVGVTTIMVSVFISDVLFKTTVQFNITVLIVSCPPEKNEYDIYFPETPVNSEVSVNCPSAYTGQVSRKCNLNQTWSSYNYTNCRRLDLSKTFDTVKKLKANAGLYTPQEVMANLNTVANEITSSFSNSSNILSGDIKQMMEILEDVGEITSHYETATIDKETLQGFATSCDKILGAAVNIWNEAFTEEDAKGPILLDSMDGIIKNSLQTESLIDESPYVMENLAIKRARSQDDIFFPKRDETNYQDHSSWVLHSQNTAFLSKTAFENIQKDAVKYSVILYKNATEKFKINSKHQNTDLRDKVLNSNVLSFTIDIGKNTLSSPLQLSFSMLQANYSSPICSYLDTSASVPGVWASKGCTTQVLGDIIKCSCNHLTNFALLMSPYGKTPSHDNQILSIISAVGCGISIFCLVITTAIYLVLWKYVKCDRSVLAINLSVCLIVAYIVFLAGVNRTENEVGCKIVAALLHYLFLVVFFIMLSSGIEILKSVSFVFSSESILFILIPISYGIPLIIVAISLGVTKTEGYGGNTSCWLSTTNGLIWAFVGPVLLVFVINLCIIIHVLRVMQKSQLMTARSTQQRTRSVVRTICVLSPILGITWVFGILSVNESTVVFQYLFAIFNSLQGVFIFITYCLLSHQVRDGFRAMRKKVQSKSFYSSQKMASSCENGKHSESDPGFTKPNKRLESSSEGSSQSDTHTTTLCKASTPTLLDDPNVANLSEVEEIKKFC